MAASLAKQKADNIPEFTKDEIIKKIENKEDLLNSENRSIPIIGVCKDGVKFERVFTFISEINKKENSAKMIEFKVVVIIPLKSKYFKRRNEYINSVLIWNVSKYATITYYGSYRGCF